VVLSRGRITRWYLLPAVQGSMTLVCSACSCTLLPSNSFLCLWCMVSGVSVSLPPGQIHVYCAVRAWRRLMWGYYFLYIGDVLFALRLWTYQIVLHKLYYRICIWAGICCLGYCSWVFVVVVGRWCWWGRRQFLDQFFFNKLVILYTEGLWNLKLTHLLLCCCGGCVCVITKEPLGVISIKYRIVLPDDGS
jgi:hypothetical protein